jgi:hypothetical protein
VFSNSFELSIILRVGPDGLARVVTRDSRDERESALVEGFEAELLVLRRWADFHRRALGFTPSWGSYVC